MNRAPITRRVFTAVTAVLLCGSALGIFLTGPIVVRVPRIDFGVQASEQRLIRDVQALCGEFGPRDWRHPENLDRAARWIAMRLGESGLEVELQDYRVGEQTFRNVVALRRGRDPGDGCMVLGAHYDTTEGSIGADDNASGVALLLELARTLADVALQRDCYFVAFGTGAPPIFGQDGMGSRHFARRLLDQGTQVELMLSLDRVGYSTTGAEPPRLSSLAWHLLYPGQDSFTLVLGDSRAGPWIERVKHGLRAADDGPVESLRAPAWLAPVDLSDHASFRSLGLPGVQITDSASLTDAHGRPRADSPGRLDYSRMTRLVRALHGVLRENRVAPPS